MNDLEDITISSSISSNAYYAVPTDYDHSYIDTSTMGTGNLTIGSLTTSTIPTYSTSTGTITLSDYTINLDDIDFTEFEGIMPNIDKVKEMCNEYPALEKAYENFKLIYKLVHDDWISRQGTPYD